MDSFTVALACVRLAPIQCNSWAHPVTSGLSNIVYFCSQSLYKYLPQYDYVLATIAQQVPTAQFVFVNRVNPSFCFKFKQRLKGIFDVFNLDFEIYCIFLSKLSHDEYLNLNLIVDVFLDREKVRSHPQFLSSRQTLHNYRTN